MKKVGYFFFCFLPILSSISLQFLAVFPVTGMIIIKNSLYALSSGQKMEYDTFLARLVQTLADQQVNVVISVIYASLGILIFGIWYYAQFHGDLHFPVRSFSKPGLILGLVLLVPGLQLSSSILTVISAAFFPGWMDFYEKLMETAGLTQSPSFLLVLYAVLLGPIAEELTFRGVTLASAKKALPFWAANLFQAVLFGIFHLNLIQGIYAFFIGLFLGYVCHRGGSIWLSIFLHILFNFWGTFITSAIDSTLLIFSFFPLGIVGMVLFYKNTYYTGINHSPNFSDM